MEIENMLVVYLYGWVVTSFAFFEELTVADFFAAFALGALWPIVVPGCAIRKIIK